MDLVLIDIENGVLQIRNQDLVSGVLLVGDYDNLVYRCKRIVVQSGSPELVSSLAISEDDGRTVLEVESVKTLLLGIVDSDTLLACFDLDALKGLVVLELSMSLEGEFSKFALWQPENNDLLVINDRVGENLGSGVEKCLLAKVEVCWDDLGLVAVDGDIATVLGDGHVFAVGAGALIEVAAPAGRIAVDTSDVDVASCIGFEINIGWLTYCVWGVVENRNVDTSIPGGFFEKLHVVCSRLVENPLIVILPLTTQLVFNLNTNIATVSDEVGLNDLGDLSPVLGPSLRKSGVIIAKLAVLSSGDPKGESSGVSFGIDVGTRTDEEVKTELLGQGHDGDEIVGAILKIEDAGGGFVVAPAVVDAEGSEAGSLDLL
ncbi:hypothetical protein HG530_013646 [Fusarium avenaceum]|nr:hypothetical protein HG530_013646 [Fusarium avenaceum]